MTENDKKQITEFREKLYDIAHEVEERYSAELEALENNPEKRQEKKALIIAKNHAGHCAGFTKIMYAQDLSGTIETRERMVFVQTHLFDDCRDSFHALNTWQKGAFIFYAHATMLILNSFYFRNKQILQSEDKPDTIPQQPEKLLTAKIAVSVVGEILEKWYVFWQDTGILPLERRW